MLLVGALLGVVGLVAAVIAWRGNRAALRVCAGALIVNLLLTLPAFFVDVPSWIKAAAAFSALLTVAAVVLMFSTVAPARAGHGLRGRAMIAVVTVLGAFALGYFLRSRLAANTAYAVAYLWAFTFQTLYLMLDSLGGGSGTRPSRPTSSRGLRPGGARDLRGRLRPGRGRPPGRQRRRARHRRW